LRLVLVDTPLGKFDDREVVKVGAIVTIDPGGAQIGGPPGVAAFADGLLARANDPSAVFAPINLAFDFPGIDYGRTGSRVDAVGAPCSPGVH